MGTENITTGLENEPIGLLRFKWKLGFSIISEFLGEKDLTEVLRQMRVLEKELNRRGYEFESIYDIYFDELPAPPKPVTINCQPGVLFKKTNKELKNERTEN